MSSGKDGIPNLILKHLPIIRRYCTIFNNALNNAYFVTDMENGQTSSDTKKGEDLCKYESYRPIKWISPFTHYVPESTMATDISIYLHNQEAQHSKEFASS